MNTAPCNDGLPDERLMIDRVAQIDSTNSELLRREPLLPAGSAAQAIWLVARRQSAGRGRRDRPWRSSADGSLTASFGIDMRLGRPSNPAALSLVAGVAVAQVLAEHDTQVRLKWPNDIYVAGGKAGGILCEARARGEVTRLVIGCGLNLIAPAPGEIDQPAAGLFELATLPERGRLEVGLGLALLAAVTRWQVQGLAPFRNAWRARDLLSGEKVVIHDYSGIRYGVARGIADDGALIAELQESPGRLVYLNSGEVSIRKLPLAG